MKTEAQHHEVVVPALGESIQEAVVARWLKKIGEQTAADEPLVELETDKVTVDLRAPAAGVLVEQRVAEGATVKIGQVVGILDSSGASDHPAPRGQASAAKAAPPAEAEAPRPTASAEPSSARPTPPAREVQRGNGGGATTDLSGQSSKIERRLPPSARRALHEQEDPVSRPSMAAGSTPEKIPAGSSGNGKNGQEEVVPMSPLRQRIAQKLVAAHTETASLTTFNEVDMSAVLATRARHQERFLAKYNLKLGLMSFFTKASIAALEEFPGLNAEVRDQSIVYKHHYDIGIAIGSGRGLVVPVLRRAGELSFAQIEQALAALAMKAKENRLTLEDLAGGTFTITNGGVFGSMLSTPLLNYPQTGILGMHNIVRRPVVIDERVEIRPIMYLALTYDHRVVDGREAVQFLVRVKERIENPERLMLAI